MRDVLDAIEGWRAEGHRVALATVTKVKGSAPRPPGAKMAISDDGRWVGSVSGGCVEGAVLEEAGRVLGGGGGHTAPPPPTPRSSIKPYRSGFPEVRIAPARYLWACRT
jgi:xanthine/CO dehydrogenase XdhC/CoxF family maturation factor